jgi:trimethylamine--corrinoid protein Co-methyltransferase
LRYRHAPFELLSSDAIESIHQAGLSILQETGMLILSPQAREYYVSVGFDAKADSELLRFDRELVESLLAKAPSSFTLQARNPDKNIRLGDGNAVFTSVGGPAYVMDSDKGRRNGSYAEMCDFIRLVQSLDILHQEGGGGFEAMDLPAASRHLDLFYAECTLLDKNWIPWTMGRDQTLDAIRMAAISLGQTPEALADSPALCGIINTNTPLQLDIPMAEGLITLAQHGQAAAVTPFTLSGAMAPVTLAGALALQHAEAMAGIALTQIVRPGAPVLYGGFTSNVDMKTGSPAFGTPEYLQAAQASGQLARRLGVPLRSSNVNAANCPDAQAAYESCLSLWGAISGQASMIKHAAGWLHGGLTACNRSKSIVTPWPSTPFVKSAPADTFSAARTPWSATSRPSTRRCCRTGVITKAGSKPVRSIPSSAPTRSGNSCCGNTSNRRSMRLSTRNCGIMSHDASVKSRKRADKLPSTRDSCYKSFTKSKLKPVRLFG